MEYPLKPAISRWWREGALAALLAAPLFYLLSRERMPQEAIYHLFADGRSFAGIPNFGNVVSNFPFLLVGAAGMLWCTRMPAGGATRSWMAFFAGTALVSFGSAYYHWAPDNGSLFWDRLPMTLAFTSLLVALLAESVEASLQRALGPALAVGIASLLWWRLADDLRFYYWVQLASLLAIPAVLILYRGAFTHRRYLAGGFALYALAKYAEFHDGEIFDFTAQQVSGHSIKHLLGAAGVFCVYLMLRRRSPLAPPRVES